MVSRLIDVQAEGATTPGRATANQIGDLDPLPALESS